MSVDTILIVLALVLAILSFVPRTDQYPTLPIAVILICIALLI